MAQRWRNMIQNFAADPSAVRDLLTIIPRIWRQGSSVPAGLATATNPRQAHVDFLRTMWEKMTPGSTNLFNSLPRTIQLMRIIEGVASLPPARLARMMDRLQRWSGRGTLEFLTVHRRLAQAFGDAEADRIMRWMLEETFGTARQRIRFDNLRLNHPVFRGGNPDPAAIRAFEDGIRRLRQWDHTVEDILVGGVPTRIPGMDPFGRRLEGLAREQYQAVGRVPGNSIFGQPFFPAGRLGDLDAVDLSAKSGNGWKFTGQNYASSRNFPGADMLFTDASGAVRVGQISHGSAGSLLGKFRALFDLSGGSVDRPHLRMVENFQYMGGIISTPSAGVRGTEAALESGSRELMPKLTLFVPEKEVIGLRGVIASSPSFGIWKRLTGLTGDQLLEAVQGIGLLRAPGSPL